MAEHRALLRAALMHPLQVMTTLLALCALTASAILFLLLQAEQREAEKQRTELTKVRNLSVETAESVVLQHRAIGMMIDTQKNLFKIVQNVNSDQRQLYYSATP